MPACGLRGRVYSRMQGGAPLCGAVPMERKRKEEVDMTNILLEKKGYIAVATINRPKALNALNSEVLSDLDELVATVKADDEIRALVITGSGDTFTINSFSPFSKAGVISKEKGVNPPVCCPTFTLFTQTSAFQSTAPKCNKILCPFHLEGTEN